MKEISTRMTEIKEKIAKIMEMNEMSARRMMVNEVSARLLELKGVMKEIICSWMVKTHPVPFTTQQTRLSPTKISPKSTSFISLSVAELQALKFANMECAIAGELVTFWGSCLVDPFLFLMFSLILERGFILRLKGDGGLDKYHEDSFVVECTGDVCVGNVILFKQKVYEKTLSKTCALPPLGERIIAGRVVKETPGTFTFTIEVLWTKGLNPLPPLFPLTISRKELYMLKIYRQLLPSEEIYIRAMKEHAENQQRNSIRGGSSNGMNANGFEKDSSVFPHPPPPTGKHGCKEDIQLHTASSANSNVEAAVQEDDENRDNGDVAQKTLSNDCNSSQQEKCRQQCSQTELELSETSKEKISKGKKKKQQATRSGKQDPNDNEELPFPQAHDDWADLLYDGGEGSSIQKKKIKNKDELAFEEENPSAQENGHPIWPVKLKRKKSRGVDTLKNKEGNSNGEKQKKKQGTTENEELPFPQVHDEGDDCSRTKKKKRKSNKDELTFDGGRPSAQENDLPTSPLKLKGKKSRGVGVDILILQNDEGNNSEEKQKQDTSENEELSFPQVHDDWPDSLQPHDRDDCSRIKKKKRKPNKNELTFEEGRVRAEENDLPTSPLKLKRKKSRGADILQSDEGNYSVEEQKKEQDKTENEELLFPQVHHNDDWADSLQLHDGNDCSRIKKEKRKVNNNKLAFEEEKLSREEKDHSILPEKLEGNNTTPDSVNKQIPIRNLHSLGRKSGGSERRRKQALWEMRRRIKMDKKYPVHHCSTLKFSCSRNNQMNEQNGDVRWYISDCPQLAAKKCANKLCGSCCLAVGGTCIRHRNQPINTIPHSHHKLP